MTIDFETLQLDDPRIPELCREKYRALLGDWPAPGEFCPRAAAWAMAWLTAAQESALSQPAEGQEPVSECARTAPERIWLQVSDGDEWLSKPFPRNPDGDEVTWCAAQQGGTEVPYVRADLARPAAPLPPAQPQEPVNRRLLEALRECLFYLNDNLGSLEASLAAKRGEAAIAEAEAQAAQPVGTDATWPVVPDDVIQCVQAYGDARADDDGSSALRLGDAIAAMRRWAAQPVGREAMTIGTKNVCVTDCRSDVGITVSLVDGLIAISRVLTTRDLSAREVQEALADLRSDDDMRRISTPEPSTVGREPLTKAAEDVLAERRRQVEVEGWTPEHDDEHGQHELAHAAACYAYPELTCLVGVKTWPWDEGSFKVKDQRSNYVRAAALLLASIERLDRAHGITGEGV